MWTASDALRLLSSCAESERHATTESKDPENAGRDRAASGRSPQTKIPDRGSFRGIPQCPLWLRASYCLSSAYTQLFQERCMADQVLVEVKERVMWIRMNRPEKKNALTGAMYTAMSDAISQAGNDSGVRAVLITGTQDCFTAGNDLVDFANAKPGGGPAPAITFLQTISTAQKPVIAAVSGVAVGIGTTMLLHCDLVYAGTSAKFHLPFVNLGLCAEGGSSL